MNLTIILNLHDFFDLLGFFLIKKGLLNNDIAGMLRQVIEVKTRAKNTCIGTFWVEITFKPYQYIGNHSDVSQILPL